MDRQPAKGVDQLRPPRDVGYLARANVNEGRAQRDSYFICPMKRAGRHDSTDHRHHRDHAFNEVFLDEVRRRRTTSLAT